MHCCLYISEILILIFEHFQVDDDCPRSQTSEVNKKTLATLARTCRPFSSPALDVLWRHLDKFDPLLNVLPAAPFLADDAQWLTFREYAKRVKTIRGLTRALVSVKWVFLSSLRDCPKAYLPLLPNLTKVEWNSHSLSSAFHRDSKIRLLKYLAGPSVTTVSLAFLHQLDRFSADLAVMAGLPKLCPNITSLSIVLRYSWTYKVAQEVGRIVTQWLKLKTLRISAIPQSSMDALLARGTLQTLHIDYDTSSPIFTGRIPDAIRDFSLDVDCPLTCTRFFKTVHANPVTFYLGVDMNDSDDTIKEEEIEEMFHILPRRLDTSRLLSLTIRSNQDDMEVLWLRKSLVSTLVQFTSLRELDLDFICTAEMSDADYAYLAESLVHLRHLKLGTANENMSQDELEASVGAVIAVLTSCEHLETFHIVFNGSTPPPAPSILEGGGAELSGGLVRHGWGVSNRRITKLCVGYSPIDAANVDSMASCLKSIMPCLVKIEHQPDDEAWEAVQNSLKSH